MGPVSWGPQQMGWGPQLVTVMWPQHVGHTTSADSPLSANNTLPLTGFSEEICTKVCSGQVPSVMYVKSQNGIPKWLTTLGSKEKIISNCPHAVKHSVINSNQQPPSLQLILVWQSTMSHCNCKLLRATWAHTEDPARNGLVLSRQLKTKVGYSKLPVSVSVQFIEMCIAMCTPWV